MSNPVTSGEIPATIEFIDWAAVSSVLVGEYDNHCQTLLGNGFVDVPGATATLLPGLVDQISQKHADYITRHGETPGVLRVSPQIFQRLRNLANGQGFEESAITVSSFQGVPVQVDGSLPEHGICFDCGFRQEYHVEWVEFDGHRYSFDFDPNKKALPQYMQDQQEIKIKERLKNDQGLPPSQRSWDWPPDKSGWELVPEELRFFGPAKFFFNFRQNLEFLCNCVDNVPRLEVMVLAPTSYIADQCMHDLHEYIHGTSLVAVYRRRPIAQAEFSNGSKIRFISTDNGRSGMRVRGYRPDFFIVKELTRSDW